MDVPSELKRRPQWATYRGANDKAPRQVNGQLAKSNDRSTWTTLEEASRDDSGVGFIFADGDGLFGIDLDSCIGPDGEIQAWATEITKAFVNTYAEFSPSGTGIKIFGLGRLPMATGRKVIVGAPPFNFPQVCDKPPAVEAYDHLRFFTFTGERLPDHATELGDCQAALDAFCARFFPVRDRPKMVVPSRPAGGHNLEQRAALYIDQIERTICGSASCHDRTFYAACVLVIEFNLSPERAFPILSFWAGQGQHPWTEKELWHKLNSANEKTSPRGNLANAEYYIPETGPEVDLSGILSPPPAADPEPERPVVLLIAEHEDEEEADPYSEHPGRFPLEALRTAGLLTDIVSHTLATSLYPQPELSLAAAISLLATITGRKVTDAFGTRTNCYVLGLDLTGAGKDHPRLKNKEYMLQVGAQPMIGPERIGSHAGIIAHLANQPALLCQIDEMGKFLATCKDPKKSPHLYNVTTVMMQLYSSSKSLWVSDAYADIKRTKTINQPHLVVYGTATPDSFWQNLSSENISDGLIGRLMAFEGRGYEVEMQEPVTTPIPETITEPLRWWMDFKPGVGNLSAENPTPRLIPHTPEARARFMGHIKSINEKRRTEDPLRAALWSRSAEKVGKLALIHSCSRTYCLPETITLEDVNWGILVVNWMTRRILMQCTDHVSENDVEARAKRILQIIGNRRMSLNEITRKTQWMRPRERDDYLKNFTSCGLLDMEVVPTKGRPKIVYWRPKRTSNQVVNLPSTVKLNLNPFGKATVSG